MTKAGGRPHAVLAYSAMTARGNIVVHARFCGASAARSQVSARARQWRKPAIMSSNTCASD
eukprot:10990021-Lingulodinium_polyedra.AAC.1